MNPGTECTKVTVITQSADWSWISTGLVVVWLVVVFWLLASAVYAWRNGR